MVRKKLSPEQRVKNFIQEHNLVSSQDRLLVAVSGGADSICLLDILVRLKDELGIGLHVAHLNHQLRGTESDADAHYVAEMADRLGVPATIKNQDIRAHQKQYRLSLEEAAREVRYRFLADTAGTIGASLVAVGHTIDDQVETILMHLVRGTGTRGLVGLRPCIVQRLPPDGEKLTVVRPLLGLYRQEVSSYCRNNHLMPHFDTSNRSLTPLRNRIRLKLLPLLKSYNPQVIEALLRTGTIAADELAFLDEETARLWDSVAERRGNVITLDKKSFGRLHPALKRHLLRASISRLLGSFKDIETRHIFEIMAALNKPAGKQINLPDGLIFAIEYDKYLLGSDSVVLSPFPILEGEFALKIPGKTQLSGWCVEAAIINLKREPERGETFRRNPHESLACQIPTDRPFAKKRELLLFLKEERERFKQREKDKRDELPNNLTAYFDFAKTGDKIIIRSRKRGDRFQPLGLSQPKKLVEFMTDAKIPRTWRGRVPIVSSSEHILWLVGWRIDERVKVTENTKKVLYLTAMRLVE